MSTLPEQFSAARKAQLDVQFDAFRTFSSKAVENTEKLIALNLNTSRAAFEKSTAALHDLLSAKDPRDLFALTTHSHDSFNNLLAYSRALFGIAGNVRAELSRVPVAPVLSAPTLVRTAAPAPAEADEDALNAADAQLDGQLEEQARLQAAAYTQTIAVSAAPPAASEPATEPDPLPLAEPTPIAKALASVVPDAQPATPAAAPLPPANPDKVSSLPIDAAPPAGGKPALVKQADGGPSKAPRKK